MLSTTSLRNKEQVLVLKIRKYPSKTIYRKCLKLILSQNVSNSYSLVKCSKVNVYFFILKCFVWQINLNYTSNQQTTQAV